ALDMIWSEQSRTGLCLPFLPFVGLVTQIGQGFKTNLTYRPAAIRIIAEALQCYLISLLNDANLVAIYAGRVCLEPKDIQFARRIRGERA
ncbi:hypothetical protein EMIHUDRAFT_48284, partial [Emiliania huxleyi CCMP1516]|uniref:Core Histone H2A/H2B/H3 domain-containing protein n=2 Tax=Emiliania huxleyi TaxID=2903 RepID=A0A0D3KEE0_EMIH1